MTSYAALLRAINVGGTGKLAMNDLRKLCEGCGFTDVATYIQSGNVVFRSRRAEASVKALLEAALAKKLGKPYAALIRTAPELRALLRANPFPKAAPNHLYVLFLDSNPPKRSLDDVVAPGGEELAQSGRHVFIHFPNGMGKSKLKIPFQKIATARNLNTVLKMVEMLAVLDG